MKVWIDIIELNGKWYLKRTENGDTIYFALGKPKRRSEVMK